MAVRLAVIGGTGVYDPSMLFDVRDESVDTPYGRVVLKVGRLPGGGAVKAAFLARHGVGHAVPPHRVNYRANIWALKSIGVERILATAAVGSLAAEMKPGDFVLVDQFLDFTRGRAATFYDGEGRGVVHVDVSHPYCPELRRVLERAAEAAEVTCHRAGTYVCTEGPRFETAAEIRMYAQLGGHLVGMTGVPEVVLARELSICYAPVAMVTNYAAGITDRPLTHSEVVEVMAANAAKLRALFSRALMDIPCERRCACGTPVEVYGKDG